MYTQWCVLGKTQLVDGNDRSTTKTNVVLKSSSDMRHLSGTTLPAQLPRQFSALCKSCELQYKSDVTLHVNTNQWRQEDDPWR